jgi:hypothetical protein
MYVLRLFSFDHGLTEPAEMVDAPENLVLQMLREIRAKQEEQSLKLEAHTKDLTDIREVATLGVGLATMANSKLDRVIERLDGHAVRIERLEAVRPGSPV